MVTIKGFYIKEAVKYVEKKLGPEGLKKLEERYGRSIDFKPFKDYPMEEDANLKKAAVEVLSGSDDPAGHFEIGKLAFEIYISTTIGKTMFQLLGNDPKKVALATARVVDTVTKGLETKAENLGENHVKITMIDSPYDIQHYAGIFSAAIEYLGFIPKIETSLTGDRGHVYDIAWENNN